jgi:hypothetical protein
VAQEAGNRWVTAYARGFFAALLPSVVMLWLAIGQRVAQYGITERRYFLIVLSAWLAVIAVQQLWTRSRGIAVIPASLCAVAVITLAGPWGAYRVSERSQVHRLVGLLERNGRLVEGRARPSDAEVPEADAREILATLRYLAETHGTGAIAAWFGGADSLGRIDTVARGTGPTQDGDGRARVIGRWLGLEYYEWRPADQRWFRYVAVAPAPLALAGYDSLLVIRPSSDTATGPGLRVRTGRSGRSLEVYRDGERLTAFALDSLLALARSARPEGRPAGAVGAERLRVDRETADQRISLQLYLVEGHWNADTLVFSDLSGIVLVGRR